MELRPYQKEAVQALRDNKNGIIAAATGSGKTTMMAASIKEKAVHGKILVLVHLQDLVVQTVKRIQAETELKVSQYFGKKKETFTDSDVVVATWQSFKEITNEKRIPPDYFYSINVDEAHYLQGTKYREVVDYFKPVFLHGFTATPEGPGEEILYSIFEDVIFKIDILELIDMGYLSQLDMKIYRSEVSKLHPDLNGKYHMKKDEYIQSLENQLLAEKRVPKIIHFFKNNKHIDEFNTAVAKESSFAYSSKSSYKHRTKSLNDFKREDDRVNHLYSIRMLNEGIDIPIVNGLVFHEHSGNFRTFTQRLGRGLRVYKDANQKTYINQFLNLEDESTINSIIYFQDEVERALSNYMNEKKYKEYVRIDLDKETEAFLKEYRKRLYSNKKKLTLGKTQCICCGKEIIVRQSMIDILRDNDGFYCDKCKKDHVQTSCDKCGDKIDMLYRKYRGYVVDKSRIFCPAHSPKYSKKVDLVCPTCGTGFQMNPGQYNARIKMGSTNFYCSPKCRPKAKTYNVACKVCSQSFYVNAGRYSQKIKSGQNFYCDEHKPNYKNKKAVKKQAIQAKPVEKYQLKCSVCGKEEQVLERTYNSVNSSGNPFYCDEHKYKFDNGNVRCFNCSSEMYVGEKRYKDYVKKGLNFHCDDCRQLKNR